MKSISKETLINIGFISKPYEFKGELIFAVENGDAEDYLEAKFFFIQLEGKPVPFFVEAARMKGNQMIVKLEDVNTEAEAKKISGEKILVEESAATLPESEIDWNSLVGYMVLDKAYGKLGLLEGLEEYPRQIIARCTVKGKEVLFPLNEDFISEVDDEKRELHLDLPAGLIDVYLKS